MKIKILNGHVIDPINQVDHKADVFVADGKIVHVGKRADFTADATVDASGYIVCPGIVDLSMRLREPGNEYRATLESEMAAAASGGVTSLACPPDTDPALDEPGLVEMLCHRARSIDTVHVYPIGALTMGLAGNHLTEMAELTEAGCIAFSQASTPIKDTQVLLHALQYAASFDLSVWLTPRDPFLAVAGVAHDGRVANQLGLSGIPIIAETIALGTLLQLIADTGARVHICRISSAASLEMICAARKAGIAVSCDTAIHHLHLDETAIGSFDTRARLDPPLRTKEDREALCAALADGTLNAVCSDHAPVDDDMKQLPFAQAQAGASGVELLLPLTLAWAKEHKIPLITAIARITSDAAQIARIPAGSLNIGASADICIFDLKAHFTVSYERMASQGKNTPFLQRKLPGVVQYTLNSGRVAYSSWEL